MCLETWGRSPEEQWQSLHAYHQKHVLDVLLKRKTEGQRSRDSVRKRSNSLREGSREPNSDNGIMLLIHNLYTRTSVYTVHLEVTCVEHDAAVLIQLQLPCVPSQDSSVSMASAGRSLLACSHQHQGDIAVQSLKFAPFRTSYRTVWDLIIVCTHDEKLLSPHAGRSQRLRRLKVAPKLDFLRHFLCHVACSKLQT